MLSISGRRFRLCDGVTRRDALKIGALGIGGLTLPELLRAEAQAGVGSSHAPRKNSAVIMIYLAGAPPHQDMYDLKMDAPSDIRGEFRPIKTNVPGIEICELLPRMARIMDKLVPLRSVYGTVDDLHDSYICYTGRPKRNEPRGGLAFARFLRLQNPRTAPAGRAAVRRDVTQNAASPLRFPRVTRLPRSQPRPVSPVGAGWPGHGAQ